MTRQVNSQLGQGFFADPAFMTYLDVAFANLYFAAAGAAGTAAAAALAWRPLAEQRATAELAVDRHLWAVENLIANWTINSARDLAWNNCLLLWAVRDNVIARGNLLDTLAASTALASRMLLVAV